MTNKPERIWVDLEPGSYILKGPLASHPRTEYIRADLVPQWQPIETALRDGTRIILYVPFSEDGTYCDGDYEYGYDEDIFIGRFHAPYANPEGEWVKEGAASYDIEVPTHWMPLPEPPQ